MAYLPHKLLCVAGRHTRFSASQFQGITLVLSLQGTFTCQLQQQSLQGLSGLLINRSIVHSLVAQDATLLIYYFDFHHPLEYTLEQYLGKHNWLNFSKLILALSLSFPDLTPDEQLSALAQQRLTALFPNYIPLRASMDERMEKLMAHIDSNIHNTITLAELASLVFLSVERTRHLFPQRIGMTFSQYLIWLRMKRAILSILSEKNQLGKVAIQCGFTDQSHFNRLFKRLFGVKPHTLLKSKKSCWILME